MRLQPDTSFSGHDASVSKQTDGKQVRMNTIDARLYKTQQNEHSTYNGKLCRFISCGLKIDP